jgi:hypothetical protein
MIHVVEDSREEVGEKKKRKRKNKIDN